MAALIRLATPPIKYPVMAINAAFVVWLLGESEIYTYIQTFKMFTTTRYRYSEFMVEGFHEITIILKNIIGK